MTLRAAPYALFLSLCGCLLVAAGCGGNSLAPPGNDLGSDDGGGSSDDSGLNCGNGVVNPGEQCDKGSAKNTHGSGCEPDCTFSCAGDAKCDDGDPCNGAETCNLAQHTCTAGKPLSDGTSCGMGKACKMGVCGAASCGDKVVEGMEECDDGNTTNGDGCDNDCRFSCVSTDMTRNCTPMDPCAGQGMCVDASHTCTAGMMLTDGTSCGAMNAYCKMGVCTLPVCGNSVVEPGEDCDNGNKNGPGSGCELDCKFSCVNALTDCAMMAPACEKWSCDQNHACAAIADGTLDGKVCGMNLVCKAGACIAQNAVCGNGVVEPGEDCDFGNGNAPGSGCEKNCKFSCVKMPNSCATNPCTSAPQCATVMVNGHAGQACMPGTPVADGLSCGMNNLICIAGNCQTSMCGDGYVDKVAGETCEPPGTNSCDAQCHAKAICGNAVREGNEQCDDGNMTSLDGCTPACLFEQTQRVNWLKLQFATDKNCPKNGLGGAIVNNLAQTQLQTSLDNGIKDGSISILFAMLGITDLTGTTEPKASIGVVNGIVETPMGAPAYNGSTGVDLDWWYQADPLTIDNTRTPTAKLAGSIAAKVLTAGPGSISLTLNLGMGPAPLAMSNVTVAVSIGAVSTPLTSMNNLPPGHVAAEHLDPNLMSYAATGQQNANGAGNLCGNISTFSLSKVLLPAAVVQNCTAYSAQNSILDLLVGGCTAFGILQLVKPTQPQEVDANQPVAGAGAPYTLSASKGKTIDTCTDKNKMKVPLATCLNAAAYSSYFKLTTDRVIINK